MTGTSHSPRVPVLQPERLGQIRPSYRLQSVQRREGCRVLAADGDLGAQLSKRGIVHGLLRVHSLHFILTPLRHRAVSTPASANSLVIHAGSVAPRPRPAILLDVL